MCQTGAAVFDEGAEARYVVIDGRRMQPERGRIVPLSGGKEAGAEGAPRDRSFAVAGFHSARRGACEANPDSRRVFRFGLDEPDARSLTRIASRWTWWTITDDSGTLCPRIRFSEVRRQMPRARMDTALISKGSQHGTASSISASASRRSTRRPNILGSPRTHCFPAVTCRPGCSRSRQAR